MYVCTDIDIIKSFIRTCYCTKKLTKKNYFNLVIVYYYYLLVQFYYKIFEFNLFELFC